MVDWIEEVARAWASIDGKKAHFDACKQDPKLEQVGGYYQGYMADAQELLKRSGLAKHLGLAP